MKRIIMVLILTAMAVSLFAIEGKILTTIYYSVDDEWFNTISETMPIIPTVDTVSKDQNFLIIPIITGYAVDENNEMNVTFDITVTQPDNKINFSQKDVPGFKGKVKDPAYAMISGEQMDALWCEFFAAGNYKPIEKLIRVLGYYKYMGALDKYKKSTTKSKIEKNNAIKEAIFQTAIWSLKSNCKQHDLVKNYCRYALENDDKLDDSMKYMLAKIIKGEEKK
jgi:hypothetical protein